MLVLEASDVTGKRVSALVVPTISAVDESFSMTLSGVAGGFPRDAASLCVCVCAFTHHLLLQ